MSQEAVKDQDSRSLTSALAQALGLPRNTVRAVLTLDVAKPPRLELTMFAIDSVGRPIVQEAPGEYGESPAKRLAQVQFMVRLEPFPDFNARVSGPQQAAQK